MKTLTPEETVDLLARVVALHEHLATLGVRLALQVGGVDNDGLVVNAFADKDRPAPCTDGATLRRIDYDGHCWHETTLAGVHVAIHGLPVDTADAAAPAPEVA